jgi:hypothetical protein
MGKVDQSFTSGRTRKTAGGIVGEHAGGTVCSHLQRILARFSARVYSPTTRVEVNPGSDWVFREDTPAQLVDIKRELVSIPHE